MENLKIYNLITIKKFKNDCKKTKCRSQDKRDSRSKADNLFFLLVGFPLLQKPSLFPEYLPYIFQQFDLLGAYFPGFWWGIWWLVWVVAVVFSVWALAIWLGSIKKNKQEKNK